MKITTKLKKLNDKDFKQLTGVKRETFNEMVKILKIAYAEKHRNRGRHSKLNAEEKLYLCLKYNRQYLTQKELAFEFSVGEATVHDTIVWVENILINSGKFALPSKKVLFEENEIEIVLIDVTETPIERPKKNKKNGTLERKSDIQ